MDDLTIYVRTYNSDVGIEYRNLDNILPNFSGVIIELANGNRLELYRGHCGRLRIMSSLGAPLACYPIVNNAVDIGIESINNE